MYIITTHFWGNIYVMKVCYASIKAWGRSELFHIFPVRTTTTIFLVIRILRFKHRLSSTTLALKVLLP